MGKQPIDSLTAQERVVLRLVKPGFEIKLIARELGLSPDTVKAHLRHCRAKLGVSSSLAAAKLLAEAECRTEFNGVTPAKAMAPPSVSKESTEATWGPVSISTPAVVREAPASVSFGIHLARYDAPAGGKRNGLSPLLRITLMIAMVVGLVLAIVAAPALYDSTQRVANAIDPPFQ